MASWGGLLNAQVLGMVFLLKMGNIQISCVNAKNCSAYDFLAVLPDLTVLPSECAYDILSKTLGYD